MFPAVSEPQSELSHCHFPSLLQSEGNSIGIIHFAGTKTEQHGQNTCRGSCLSVRFRYLSPFGLCSLRAPQSCGHPQLVSAVSWEQHRGTGIPAEPLVWDILLLQLMWGGEGGNPWHLFLQHSSGRKVLLGWALQRIYTLRDSPGGLCFPSVTWCTCCTHPAAHEGGLGSVWQLTGLTMNAQQRRHQHNIHRGNLEITSVPSNGHMDGLAALKPNSGVCARCFLPKVALKILFQHVAQLPSQSANRSTR